MEALQAAPVLPLWVITIFTVILALMVAALNERVTELLVQIGLIKNPAAFQTIVGGIVTVGLSLLAMFGVEQGVVNELAELLVDLFGTVGAIIIFLTQVLGVSLQAAFAKLIHEIWKRVGLA